MMIDIDLSTLIIGLFILGFVLEWMKHKRNKSKVHILCFSVCYMFLNIQLVVQMVAKSVFASFTPNKLNQL
ncbi:hypothetical protein EDD58_103385 [Hazenella coriacea]|uniref:Uncharacterized protein n=1 Tax=Hazenella coriacea TaxID=1179467 RepID=A0A4R3L7L8_9BACL|nr:hypothetical protein EDD58_103385 [Hazenella coriacea]